MQGKVGRVQTFAGIFVARQRYYSLCAINSIALYMADADEMLYLILRKRGKSGKTDAARRFRSSTSRNDAVKPVEDKRACRIGVSNDRDN